MKGYYLYTCMKEKKDVRSRISCCPFPPRFFSEVRLIIDQDSNKIYSFIPHSVKFLLLKGRFISLNKDQRRISVYNYQKSYWERRLEGMTTSIIFRLLCLYRLWTQKSVTIASVMIFLKTVNLNFENLF